MKPAPGSAAGWQRLELIGTGRHASNHYIAAPAWRLPAIHAARVKGFHYLQLQKESPLALQFM